MGIYIYGKKKNLFLSFLMVGILVMYPTQKGYCFPFFRRFFFNVKEEEPRLQPEILAMDEDSENEGQEEIIDTLNFLNKKVERTVYDNHLNIKLASRDLQISILENLNRFKSKMVNNNILNEDTILDLQELYNSISNNFVEFGSEIDGTNKFTIDEISKTNVMYGDIVNSTSAMYKRANILNKQSEISYWKSIALNEEGIALSEKTMKYLKVVTSTVASVLVGTYFYLGYQGNIINIMNGVINNLERIVDNRERAINNLERIIDNQERIINNLENVINHIRNIFGTIQ